MYRIVRHPYRYTPTHILQCFFLWHWNVYTAVLTTWSNPKNIPDNKVHGANMGPTWGDRTQVGSKLSTWTLLSGIIIYRWVSTSKMILQCISNGVILRLSCTNPSICNICNMVPLRTVDTTKPKYSKTKLSTCFAWYSYMHFDKHRVIFG